MSKLTRVVNLKKVNYDVYIGRAGQGEDGYFGNPIRMKGKSLDARILCLADFHQYFIQRMARDREYAQRILVLRGKVLGCFCRPLICHGDIIAAFLNALPERAGPPTAMRAANAEIETELEASPGRQK